MPLTEKARRSQPTISSNGAAATGLWERLGLRVEMYVAGASVLSGKITSLVVATPFPLRECRHRLKALQRMKAPLTMLRCIFVHRPTKRL